MSAARPLAAAFAAALALGTGCGYKLAGTGSFLPASIRTIAVAPFENRSARPEIEVRTTEAVARELSRRGGYKVVTDKAQADAYLEGAVTDFRTTPVQFNAQGRATRVETAVVLRASLRDLASGQVLWSQASLLFRDQYDVQQEQANYFDLETTALDTLARGAAQTLVNSITEGF
ncbi:MAG TPA: LPS assembly lipoprotein LptE [Candidatus Polarisedimenticolaceae bacterium]|nr:LPS assembly lipoprotein LptE [Candidatus Polarisedimenticolaceae bacterium]